MSNTEINTYIDTIKNCIKIAEQQHSPKQLGITLFGQYFEKFPETREFFKESDVPTFAARKYQYIADFFIDTVEHPNYAEDHVSYEVDRRQVYGVKDPEYYYAIIDVFQNVILLACDQADKHSIRDEQRVIWNEVASAMKAHIRLGAGLYL